MIIGYDRKSIAWNCRQITKMIDNKTVRFDSAVQRTLVWDLDKKSLLIHSLIIGCPTPPMFATRGKDKVYDFLDGKQRCNAIHDYLNGVFSLRNVPPIEYDDGTYVDINGMFFSGLTEEMQDNINSYTLNINYFDDLTEEQQEDVFFRLNNGASLSTIEKCRVKCPALKDIQKLCYHPLFDFVTDKARARYADEDIITKCFAMTKMDIPSLDTKDIRPFMEKLEITKEEYSKMQDVFTVIKKMHDEMEQNDGKAVAKRLYVKTHLISIIPFVMEHGKQTEFLQKFFSGERMSISQKYNDHATAGVGHPQNVRSRIDAINEEWKRFKSH